MRKATGMAWIRVQDDFINLDNVERVNISERGEIIRFEFYGSGGHLIRAYELDKQRGKALRDSLVLEGFAQEKKRSR
jgi:uncharacterized protein YjaZ